MSLYIHVGRWRDCNIRVFFISMHVGWKEGILVTCFVFIFTSIRIERETIFYLKNKGRKWHHVPTMVFTYRIIMNYWFYYIARIEFIPDNSIWQLRYDYNSLNTQNHESMDFEQWTNHFSFLEWHLYVLNHIMSSDVAVSWIIFCWLW